MKILKNKKEFENHVLTLAKQGPHFFYFCTFGFKLGDFTKEVINSLPKGCVVKGIIGVNDKISKAQLCFFKSYFTNVKVVKNFHVKMILTNNGGVIGGRNLTDSNWEDISVPITRHAGIKNLKKHFENLYKSKKSL
jgi:hypothetical protein